LTIPGHATQAWPFAHLDKRGPAHEFQDTRPARRQRSQESRTAASASSHRCFRHYGGRPSFSGQIVTLKLFEDNSLVREALADDGNGKVLVIDGGGSLRCALVGDQLAILAHKNHWQGVVVYGCIRDSDDIHDIDLGLRRSIPIR
jgi:RraA family protein